MDAISMLTMLFPTPRETLGLDANSWSTASVRSGVDFGPSVILGGALRDPDYLKSIGAEAYAQSQFGISSGSGSGGGGYGAGLTKATSHWGVLEGGNETKADAYIGQDVSVGDRSVVVSQGGGTLMAGDDSLVRGGDYANRIFMGDRSVGVGGQGNDFISGGVNAAARGGNGDDRISLGAGAIGSGDGGDDTIKAGDLSYIDGGSGADVLTAGAGSKVVGGEGDDEIELVRSGSGRISTTATVQGGAGDDDITIGDDMAADILYAKGDGADTISAGYNTDALTDFDLSNTLLRIGDYRADQVHLTKVGDDLRLNLGSETSSDSILIRKASSQANADMSIVLRGNVTYSLGELWALAP